VENIQKGLVTFVSRPNGPKNLVSQNFSKNQTRKVRGEETTQGKKIH
jgi:hypothetical protein